MFMTVDKHFTEKGEMPKPIEDNKPTDLPATKNMFRVIAVLAALGLVAAVLFEFFWKD